MNNPFLQDGCACNEDIPAYRCILTDGDILTGKENIASRLPIKGERLPRSINIADHRPVDGNRLGANEQIAVDVAVDPDILPDTNVVPTFPSTFTTLPAKKPGPSIVSPGA